MAGRRLDKAERTHGREAVALRVAILAAGEENQGDEPYGSQQVDPQPRAAAVQIDGHNGVEQDGQQGCDDVRSIDTAAAVEDDEHDGDAEYGDAQESVVTNRQVETGQDQHHCRDGCKEGFG